MSVYELCILKAEDMVRCAELTPTGGKRPEVCLFISGKVQISIYLSSFLQNKQNKTFNKEGIYI